MTTSLTVHNVTKITVGPDVGLNDEANLRTIVAHTKNGDRVEISLYSFDGEIETFDVGDTILDHINHR